MLSSSLQHFSALQPYCIDSSNRRLHNVIGCLRSKPLDLLYWPMIYRKIKGKSPFRMRNIINIVICSWSIIIVPKIHLNYFANKQDNHLLSHSILGGGNILHEDCMNVFINYILIIRDHQSGHPYRCHTSLNMWP